MRQLASETVLSEAGSCCILSSVKQRVIVSLSISAGEEGISTGSGRMAVMLPCVRVIFCLELSEQHFYLVVPLAIKYCLLTMSMKVASAVVALMISPVIKSRGSLYLSKEASMGC